MNTGLRVIIQDAGEGMIGAQVLELDIAVASRSEEGILAELRHAILAEHAIAMELGKPPFAQLGQAPEKFFQTWELACGSDIKLLQLALPEPINHDLAIAVHAASFDLAVRLCRAA